MVQCRDGCFEMCISSWRMPVGFREDWFKLHFLISFPKDYPSNAPSIGFSTSFPYEDGGSSVETRADHPLRGKYYICLDLLGNFDSMHPEWKKRGYNSGWSPAYEISQVLQITQIVIRKALEAANMHQIEVFLKENAKFAKENMALLDEIEIHYPPDIDAQPAVVTNTLKNPSLARILQRKHSVTFKKPPSSLSQLPCTNVKIEPSSSIDVDPVDISDLKIASGIKSQCIKFMSKLSDPDLRKQFKFIMNQVAVQDEIECWYDHVSYHKTILGYGVRIKKNGIKRELHTDGILLSYPAFVRIENSSVTNHTKTDEFKYFIPAWINQDHVMKNHSRWLEVTKDCLHKLWNATEKEKLQLIKEKDYESTLLCMCAQSVYPNLINTFIVQCKIATVQERNTCDAVLQCIVNLWRTLYFFTYEHDDTKSNLVSRFRNDVDTFIAEEDKRRKNVCPDVGRLLTKSTLVIIDDLYWSQFLDALEDESGLRRCFWMQKNRVSISSLEATYKNEDTRVGRENMLFQIMIKKFLITMDVQSIVKEMDQSNCQLPERISALMTEWRKVRTEINRDESGWIDYYKRIHEYGLSEQVYQQITESDGAILNYLRNKDETSRHLGERYCFDPNYRPVPRSSSRNGNNSDNGTNNNDSKGSKSSRSDGLWHRNSNDSDNGNINNSQKGSERSSGDVTCSRRWTSMAWSNREVDKSRNGSTSTSRNGYGYGFNSQNRGDSSRGAFKKR